MANHCLDFKPLDVSFSEAPPFYSTWWRQKAFNTVYEICRVTSWQQNADRTCSQNRTCNNLNMQTVRYSQRATLRSFLFIKDSELSKAETIKEDKEQKNMFTVNPLKKHTEPNCSVSSDLATRWKAPLNKCFWQRLIPTLHKVLTPCSSLISSPCNIHSRSRLHPSGVNAQDRTEENTATRENHSKVQESNLQDTRPY